MNLSSLLLTPGRSVKLSMAMLLSYVLTLGFAQTPINPSVPKASYLLETEHPKAAVAELESAVGANPADAALLYYLGYIQLKTGDKVKALATFQKGIQLNDKEALNYAGKGHVLLAEKKLAEAKAEFEKALAISKSKNVEVLKAVVDAYLLDNKLSLEALTLLKKAKSLAASDPEVEMLYGDTYLVQSPGNGGPAVSSYEKAAALNPKIAKPHFKAGTVFERSRNNESSIENFNKAVAADANYTLAYKELADIYYLMGAATAEKSLTNFEKYLSLTENPETDPIQVQYAFILSLNKNYKKACDVFAKVIDHPEVKVVTLRHYANALSEAGDYEKSRLVFERYFLKEKPENIDAKDYSDYGKTLAKLKQDSLAAVAYSKSLAINPDQIDVLQLQADSYYKKKKWADVIDTYSKLIAKRKQPMTLDFFNIGRAYYFSNKFVDADSAFVKVVKMQPEMTIGYVWRANANASQETETNKGLAKPFFEKVVEKGGVDPVKNKKDLLDAYTYLGYYYYDSKDYPNAKLMYGKILELDPANKSAKEALDILNKPVPPPQPKKSK